MELNFDLLTQKIPVTIDGVKYELREATGGAACRYRNACVACTSFGPDGKPNGVHDIADVEPLLVSLCLYTEQGQPVPLKTVLGWPARVVSALYREAKAISDLDDKPEAVVKNDPSGTPTG